MSLRSYPSRNRPASPDDEVLHLRGLFRKRAYGGPDEPGVIRVGHRSMWALPSRDCRPSRLMPPLPQQPIPARRPAPPEPITSTSRSRMPYHSVTDRVPRWIAMFRPRHFGTPPWRATSITPVRTRRHVAPRFWNRPVDCPKRHTHIPSRDGDEPCGDHAGRRHIGHWIPSQQSRLADQLNDQGLPEGR
jgi:hypothetical protein